MILVISRKNKNDQSGKFYKNVIFLIRQYNIMCDCFLGKEQTVEQIEQSNESRSKQIDK